MTADPKPHYCEARICVNCKYAEPFHGGEDSTCLLAWMALKLDDIDSDSDQYDELEELTQINPTYVCDHHQFREAR